MSFETRPPYVQVPSYICEVLKEKIKNLNSEIERLKTLVKAYEDWTAPPKKDWGIDDIDWNGIDDIDWDG
jgi:two-component SAPR family response regulator